MQLMQEEIGRQALELFSGPYRNRIAALRELASLLQLVEEATEAAKAQSKDPSEETHRLKDRHEHIQLLFVIVYWLSPSGERSSLKKQVDVSCWHHL